MKNKNYQQIIKEINNINDLNKFKEEVLLECTKREKKIEVSEILNKIDNFTNAKQIFESIASKLMSIKEGKSLIRQYVNLIKENKSLKTIYTYYEGLKLNESSVSKKSYITEALSIGQTIDINEYINGLNKLINMISESFKILGDDYILNNVKYNDEYAKINESLLYLSSTKKTIKNLNEYFNHIDIVSENIKNDIKENNINIDTTLDEILSQNKNIKSNDIESIFETENKSETFQNYKNICLEMINKQKSLTQDKEVLTKLTEMEDKLSNKKYSYDTFTKDVFYMKELQEVLK